MFTTSDINRFLASDPSLSRRSIETYRTILITVARAAPDLDDAACQAWLARYNNPNSFNARANVMNRFRVHMGLEPLHVRQRPARHREINIIEATRTADAILHLHLRDDHRLAVTLQRYSGMRPGELLKLRRQDIEFDEYSVLVTPNEKTGPRRIRVLECTAIMRAYLQAHELPAAARLFSWGYGTYRQLLAAWSRRAGCQAILRPHDLRHVRATELARVLNENEMRLFFGWARSSTMPGFYVHLAGTEHNDRLLELAGMKKAPAAVVGAVPCPRCHTVNNSASRYCVLCGQAMSGDAADLQRRVSALSDAELEARILELIRKELEK